MTAAFDIGDFEAKLSAKSTAVRAGAAVGLFAWGSRVLAESQDLVPIEEGTLLRSGRVVVDGDSVVVSYGGGAASAYALIQHERLDFQHDAGRQAKYLEVPLVASQSYGPELVAASVQAALS